MASAPSLTRTERPERSRWLGVELRHLMALAAVAREGSFHGAAESLGYVQSAVSQQIAFLERLLDVRLLDRSRGPKPVTVTQAGRLMLAHVDGIVARLQAAEAELDALSSARIDAFRIGVHETVARRTLPVVLPAFHARAPEIGLDIHEVDSDIELFGLIENRALDLTFAELPIHPGPFLYHELLSDPYVLLVKADTDIGRRGEIASLRELASLPLIRQKTGRASALLEAHLASQHLEPEFVFRSDIGTTIQAVVAAGMGAAVLPRQDVDHDDPATRTIDLGDLVTPRRIGLVWHRDHPRAPVLDTFLQVAIDAAHGSQPKLHLATP